MKQLTAVVVFTCLVFPARIRAQEGAFINLHASTLGKFHSVSPLTTDDFGNMYADTALLDNGIGGGFAAGYRFNSQWTAMMNLDIIGQNGTTNGVKDVSSSTFIFDFGVRYGLTSSTATQPYLITNIGYYGLSFHYGDPTIYIGPGGGYSSGVDSYDGWQISGGLGLQVSNIFDVHVIGSWASVADFESKFSIRLNAGFTLWLYDEEI